MTTETIPTDMTPDEQAEAADMLAGLHHRGYRDIEQHGQIRVGARIRHVGHQWPDAYIDGSGVVVALTEKPNSGWSLSWGKPDVELIALWDKPSIGGRLSGLAQYHVEVIR